MTEYFIQTCRCIQAGMDDGFSTCWIHHDCNDGSCSHMDGEDSREEGITDCDEY